MDGTAISRNNLGFLMDGEKTPEELVEFLKTEAMFRQFDEVLRQVYPGKDIALRLERGMAEPVGKNDGAGPDMARKIQNWLKGKNIPKNRETLFQICFVLGLNEQSASLVLGTASETGIHYRNPEELVYAYGLRRGLSYREAVALKQEVQRRYPIKSGKKIVEENDASVYTSQIKDIFFQVSDDEGLMDFFRDNRERLGRLHETAYRKFAELMEQLMEPESLSGGQERRYTMEELVETYLRMHVPKTKKTAGYSMLQKVVKKYWPNESSLVNMLNRREDVSRKVMILLYLITERFDEEEDDFFFDPEPEDTDTVLAGRFQRMNLFLDGCGMNLLDVGNPFDFLVLYAMKAQEEEAVSDRMEAVLKLLFDN